MLKSNLDIIVLFIIITAGSYLPITFTIMLPFAIAAVLLNRLMSKKIAIQSQEELNNLLNLRFTTLEDEIGKLKMVSSMTPRRP